MEAAGVSAQSNAFFTAFRRLVYRFSEQMTKDECHAIIYIRLYRLKERYKDSTALEVLSKLEADGVFDASNPEGLLEVAKDIKRQDLVSEVKDFIKKRSKSEKKAGSKGAVQQPLGGSGNFEVPIENEEDLQLKATVEVTLALVTVLLQQVETLQRAVAGGKAQRARAKKVISEASQTTAALSDRLKHAEIEFGLGVGCKSSTSGSAAVGILGRSIETEDQQPIYTNVAYTGEPLGTISHSVPTGLSGQYALKPHPEPQKLSPRRPQHTQIQEKFENLEELAEEEEDDDYEKMHSFVQDENEIREWRKSLLSSNSDKFTMPPDMQSRRSELFSSRSPTTLPPGMGGQLKIKQQSRPNSYAPGPLSAPLSGLNQKQGNFPTTKTSGSATNARPTNSPRFRGAHNVNINSSSGNTTPITHTTLSVPRSSGLASLHTTSKQLWQAKEQATRDSKSLDSASAKRVTHTLPQPNRTSVSPASKSPVLSRRPVNTSTSPTLKKSKSEGNDIRAAGDSTKETEVRQSTPKEKSNVSVVKARLERLEKPSVSSKPAPSPKPAIPVAKPRKNSFTSRKFEANRLDQTKGTKDEQRVKAAATMPRPSPSTLHCSHSRVQNREDDAYITLEPGGTSASTLNAAGDSGFEDVRPLQRLEQEGRDDRVTDAPTVPVCSGVYTSLIDQRTSIPDHDGYTEVNYMY